MNDVVLEWSIESIAHVMHVCVVCVDRPRVPAKNKTQTQGAGVVIEPPPERKRDKEQWQQ